MSTIDELKELIITNCDASEPEEPIESLDGLGVDTSGRLPDEMDLREDWWKVGNQRRTGSCVGWAVGDALLRWHFVNEGLIVQDEKISVRYVWMASKETDRFNKYPTTFVERSGTKISDALKVAVKFGVALDALLPFDSGYLYSQGKEKDFYRETAKLKISEYKPVARSTFLLKQWLCFQGPIATRLDVDDTFWRAGLTDGILEKYEKPSEKQGHAVAIVGYTPEHFIIRNSWGTEKWGDDGFGYATYNYVKDAFTEFFGVVV